MVQVPRKRKSISFDDDVLTFVAHIAKKRRCSLSLIVREALLEYRDRRYRRA